MNDTKMHLSHKNWTLRDYQPNERNDYEDVLKMYQDQELPRTSRKSNWVFFFSEAKQLTVAVIARQVKSGVLRVKIIRD